MQRDPVLGCDIFGMVPEKVVILAIARQRANDSDLFDIVFEFGRLLVEVKYMAIERERSSELKFPPMPSSNAYLTTVSGHG